MRVPAFVTRMLGLGDRRSVADLSGRAGASSLAGVNVTPASALCLTAAYAAINVLSTDLASLSLGVHRRMPDGSKRPEPTNPAHELIHFRPDGRVPAFRFRQHLMGHALGWGNGLAEIHRLDSDGSPDALQLLHPGRTRAARSKDGSIWYEQDGGPTLRAENVLHVAGLGFDGLSGYSPIRLASQAIGLGLAAETFGAALFGNGSNHRGHLKTAKRLSNEAHSNLRESFERVHQGLANAHRVAVLEEGTEWVATTIPPEDAQFLQTRMFQVVEVARMFRLPPHMIGDYSQAHLSNIEEANLLYFITTLMGWCEAIEGEFNLKLFSRLDRANGLFVEHDMNSLLRGNMTARANYYEVMERIGAISPNEIRRKENMAPVPGGDVHLIPLNMTTLDKAGQPDPSKLKRYARRIARLVARQSPSRNAA